MKPNPTASPAQPQTSPRHPLLLAVFAFGLGVALAVAWFHHQRAGFESSAGLSASTQKLLGQLETTVNIRYYSLLPAGSADETLQAFAGRVAQLLNAMQAAGGGKIQLSSFEVPAETNATAASADGIQAFNLDKGDACFLGVAIASGQNKESLARLQPEWEPALESDLARAILRVAATAAPAKPAPEIAKPSAETIAAINRLIPDVNAVSIEQAGQIFSAEYLSKVVRSVPKWKSRSMPPRSRWFRRKPAAPQRTWKPPRKNWRRRRWRGGKNSEASPPNSRRNWPPFSR